MRSDVILRASVHKSSLGQQTQMLCMLSQTVKSVESCQMYSSPVASSHFRSVARVIVGSVHVAQQVFKQINLG